jgi:2-dehydro-3-deoxyphosphogluconate aldolase/(4S)-4-hydroxy-2-oxoglutarate aldolase
VSADFIQRIHSEKIVPLFRKKSAKFIVSVCPLLLGSGFHTVEITMESNEAVESIRLIKHAYSGIYVGAGTVKTIDDVDKALDAGADFIVTPILNHKLLQYLNEKGVPFISGAFTPSEIFDAYQHGAAMVKVFPAAALGTGFIKNLKGPLSEIPLMVTGGINLGNCVEFLQAGADAVGVGSSLIPKEAVQAEDWDAVKRSLEEWRHATAMKNKQIS